MTFERAGVPAVGVMTSAFVDGAELMAHACGAPDYRFAVIEHPVSSASDAELEQRARAVLEEVERMAISTENG